MARKYNYYYHVSWEYGDGRVYESEFYQDQYTEALNQIRADGGRIIENNISRTVDADEAQPQEITEEAPQEAQQEAPEEITAEEITAEEIKEEARKAWSQAEEYSAAAIDAEIAGNSERAAHLYRLGTEALHRHADLLHAAYMARSN